MAVFSSMGSTKDVQKQPSSLQTFKSIKSAVLNNTLIRVIARDSANIGGMVVLRSYRGDFLAEMAAPYKPGAD
jgi:hypothetical protein